MSEPILRGRMSDTPEILPDEARSYHDGCEWVRSDYYRDLEALAESAEDDCQRAISRAAKAELDLKCLEESTVDSKAFYRAKARIAELEAALDALHRGESV